MNAEYVARLDAEVDEHKREMRRHREALRIAAQKRDSAIAFCEAHGIPYYREGTAVGGTAANANSRPFQAED